MGTMKLYLDDIRPAPDGWVRTRTAQETIAILKEGEVTEISLDHDLGEGDVGTGYDPLLWIEKAVHAGTLPIIPLIHIHTANPVAGSRMAQAVRQINMERANQRIETALEHIGRFMDPFEGWIEEE
jgi:hypothetical protein|tara:strand:- start:201 stop:578 length:378 start_codon:yes stop_codon:yes gene_type:complete